MLVAAVSRQKPRARGSESAGAADRRCCSKAGSRASARTGLRRPPRFVEFVESGDKPCIKPGSGAVFKDCADCPEMTIVPEGRFIMGSPETEPERQSDETQHEVRFPKPFAVGRFAVTFAEWDACVADGGCGGSGPAARVGGATRPVINVNWNHAKSYVQWLSKKTGRQYRLLSEAERESRRGREP